jgi:hypothetical protein
MDRLALVLALLLAGASLLAQPRVPDTSGRSLYEQGSSTERDGNMKEAVNLYVQAARAGEAQAARRLAEIYGKGIGGIARDYAESLKWDNAARILGERMIGDFPPRR